MRQSRVPGALNQSLMELGALVCTPKNPRCLLCPVGPSCVAFAGGAPEKYPLPKLPVKRKALSLSVAWAEHDGQVLTCLRPARGLWAGMRTLPSAADAKGLAELCKVLTGARVTLGKVETRCERTLTHRDVSLSLFVVRLSGVRRGEFLAPSALALPTAFAALVAARAH